MDISLMATSLPKLLSAAVITLKLLSLSFIFWNIYWSFICNFKIK